MAELGVVSGVAGLISLGITVCKGLLVYYDSYKGSRDDINNMCALVESVGKTLLTISSLITGRKYNQSIVDIVDKSIIACQQSFDDLSKKCFTHSRPSSLVVHPLSVSPITQSGGRSLYQLAWWSFPFRIIKGGRCELDALIHSIAVTHSRSPG
jgi:hypothetical protein